jgi:diguanylate cyclase (GGDEF)-like protein
MANADGAIGQYWLLQNTNYKTSIGQLLALRYSSPVSESVRRPPAPYLAFTAVLGLAGWGFLAYVALTGAGPESIARPDYLSVVLFSVVVIAGRLGAVRTVANQVLALDGAFYVAAAVCLGSVVAGWLVATTLTADALVRLLRATPAERARSSGWLGGIGYVIFFGGMTGAVIAAIGWLFGLDGLFVLSERTDAAVLGRLLIAGATFVAVHYALQGLRAVLADTSLREFVRKVALPGAIAETAIMPLAAVVVYVYEPDEPLRFVLLGFTYVVINLGFNRIYASTVVLRRQVADLETLNASSRRLASSLETGDVLEAIAVATTSAIRGAGTLELYRLGDAGWTVDRYDTKHRRFTRSAIDEPPAAALEAIAAGVAASGDGGRWLGVPLGLYGEVVGVLAVSSTERRFGSEDRRLLEAIAAQSAVALQNAELYALAMVDGLTRLYVRRYFDARLGEEILRSKRFDTVFSVVMMDIDNFKALNDHYGHLVGDRVLVAVSEVIRRELRGVDTAARYGGEEFAMILPRTAMIEAYNLAERIRAGIEALEVRGDARPVTVTASFGIASYPESGALDAEDLVRRSDKALYRAKRTGKNRVELFWGEGSDDEVRLSVVEETSPAGKARPGQATDDDDDQSDSSKNR